MNLTEKAVSNGGRLYPLVIPTDQVSLMNPSIFIDDNGDILVNIRSCNYTMVHSENKQRFPSRWGPLTYLHPEKDQRLVTENYLVRLNKDFEIINHAKVEMLNLHEPIWEFVGLEDGRVVQWLGKYYLIGVRRDTTTNGQGRMEYTEIEIDKDNWIVKEVNRKRIPTPGANDSYCEKNWFPILDLPFTFIKWSCPTEVVYSHPLIDDTSQIALRTCEIPPADQRGSSQLLRWGNMYIAITHEVNLFKNYLKQKDAIYRHRLLIWDQEFNLAGMSKPFSFLDFNIEFCVGAAIYEGDLLLSFSAQDNTAFILRVPKLVVEDLILEALGG